MAVVAPAVLALITAGFAVRTWIRNPDWQTELTIATADVGVSPNSFKLHRLLASSLFESDPAHTNIDRVIAEQEKSVAIVDTMPAQFRPRDVYRQAGFYYLVEGDQLRGRGLTEKASASDQRALQALVKCLSIEQAARASFQSRAGSKSSVVPGEDSQAYVLLSIAYLRSGDPGKAYEAVSQARALDPLNPQMYQQLSNVFLDQHRNDDAEVASMQASAITSLQERKWQEAADLSGRVLRFNSTDYASAYYLNAMANLHLGNLDQAERSAREAIRLDSARRNPRTSYVLGLILAEKHDYNQAAGLLKMYLDALPDAPDAEIVRRQLREIEKSGQAR
jgi:tetratricopeptide (TPR) repeat protein